MSFRVISNMSSFGVDKNKDFKALRQIFNCRKDIEIDEKQSYFVSEFGGT